MGRRGRTREYGDRIPTRFRADAESEIRVLAALWSVSVPAAIRTLVDQRLLQLRQGEGVGNEQSDH